MADSISRAEAVSLLWKLKKASEQKHVPDIPYIHFNLLLTDPDYREDVLGAIQESGHDDLQQIATALRSEALEGRLILQPMDVRVIKTSKRQTQVSLLPMAKVPEKRTAKVRFPSLSAVLLVLVIVAIVGIGIAALFRHSISL